MKLIIQQTINSLGYIIINGLQRKSHLFKENAMLTINNKMLEEKIKQLRKAIEIVGGKELLETIKSDNELALIILQSSFQNEYAYIEVLERKYSILELLKLKLEYEKNYIKTKKKYVQKIIYKIKEYNTYLDSLIRKYRKDGGIEEFRSIKNEIEIRYSMDINNFILSSIIEINADLNNDYYGEYLNSKKEDFINTIITTIV